MGQQLGDDAVELIDELVCVNPAVSAGRFDRLFRHLRHIAARKGVEHLRIPHDPGDGQKFRVHRTGADSGDADLMLTQLGAQRL